MGHSLSKLTQVIFLLLVIPQVSYGEDEQDLDNRSSNRGIIYSKAAVLEENVIEAPLAIPVVPDYVIDPPDTVQITAKDEPALTKTVVVRPDGKITYPLLREFFIQGLTPIQAEEKLEQELLKYYKEIDITVEVIGFSSKFIYVVGEVGQPTLIPFTGNQRILDILMRSSWIDLIGAKIKDIKVVRPDPYHPKIFSIDLTKLVLEGDSRQNMYLQNGDIVRVPAKLLRRVTYGVSTFVEPLGPILTGTTSIRSIRDLKNDFEGEESNNTTVVAPVVNTSTSR